MSRYVLCLLGMLLVSVPVTTWFFIQLGSASDVRVLLGLTGMLGVFSIWYFVLDWFSKKMHPTQRDK